MAPRVFSASPRSKWSRRVSACKKVDLLPRLEERVLQQHEAASVEFGRAQRRRRRLPASAQPCKKFASGGRGDSVDQPIGFSKTRKLQQQQLEAGWSELPRVRINVGRFWILPHACTHRCRLFNRVGKAELAHGALTPGNGSAVRDHICMMIEYLTARMPTAARSMRVQYIARRCQRAEIVETIPLVRHGKNHDAAVSQQRRCGVQKPDEVGGVFDDVARDQGIERPVKVRCHRISYRPCCPDEVHFFYLVDVHTWVAAVLLDELAPRCVIDGDCVPAVPFRCDWIVAWPNLDDAR